MLDHNAKPREHTVRRSRTQARQILVYPTSMINISISWPKKYFIFIYTNGFSELSGNFATDFSPSMEIRNAQHETYDLAFLLLALSSLISKSLIQKFLYELRGLRFCG